MSAATCGDGLSPGIASLTRATKPPNASASRAVRGACASTETWIMFGDYSLGDLGAILAIEGFAGLILFSVYVLMALGLAIIFGQMGVINMAHGEFMILGAYVTWMTSSAFQHYLPSLFPGYFFLAMALAFLASGALGMLLEWALIRHLYQRSLDTLLAPRRS